MQLPEVRQCVDVIFLFKVSEAEIELNFTHLGADAESPLVDLDRLSIAVSLEDKTPRLASALTLRGSASRILLKPASAAGIIALSSVPAWQTRRSCLAVSG